MAEKIFVITNSHLDPVWLWNRRSGRSAWCNTMHSVINMMKRHRELKFTCSSAAMYRWIEENDPALFRSIAKMVDAGRWEITGGWEVQSDCIIAGTESLIRQGISGKEYFRKKFGIKIDTAYCVDSFGHAAGLPEIFNAVGINKYVFLRPFDRPDKVPLLFNWHGAGGSCVTALRIMDTYNLEQVDKAFYLDRIDKHAASALPIQTLFFGVGDHGGGIYEKHLQWLEEASGKYEIVFATLQEYFNAVKNLALPDITGEIGPVFRGCYSACHQVKHQIACAGARLETAERAGIDHEVLEPLQREFLFNHFHDILPGTSIKSAYEEDVFPALGRVRSQADDLIDRHLCSLAAAGDTEFMSEGGVMVWNPDCRKKYGIISFPGFADPNETGRIFNALIDKDNHEYDMQILPGESVFGPCGAAWGKLTAVLELEPNEKKFLAWSSAGKKREPLGFAEQKKLAGQLSFLKFPDDSGTWGFSLHSFLHSSEKAQLISSEEFINGSVCSVLRLKYRLGSSEIRVDLSKYINIPEIKISLVIDWHDPFSCLKMAVASGANELKVINGTPGGEVVRASLKKEKCSRVFVNGQMVPFCNISEYSFNEWAGAFSSSGNQIIYSPDLHSFDFADWELRITLLRTALYADHHPFPANLETGLMDMNVTELELWYSESAAAPETVPARAKSILRKFEAFETTAHAAGDPVADSSLKLPAELPESVTIEGAFRNNDTVQIHLLNHSYDTYLLQLPGQQQVQLPGKALRIFEYPAK